MRHRATLPDSALSVPMNGSWPIWIPVTLFEMNWLNWSAPSITPFTTPSYWFGGAARLLGGMLSLTRPSVAFAIALAQSRSITRQV